MEERQRILTEQRALAEERARLREEARQVLCISAHPLKLIYLVVHIDSSMMKIKDL